MNITLKAKLHKAIEKVFNDAADRDDRYWDGYFSDSLTDEMTNAAEIVFDASMSGQKYAKENS